MSTEPQKTMNNQSNLVKKKVRGIAFLDFNLYYKAEVIKKQCKLA